MDPFPVNQSVADSLFLNQQIPFDDLNNENSQNNQLSGIYQQNYPNTNPANNPNNQQRFINQQQPFIPKNNSKNSNILTAPQNHELNAQEINFLNNNPQNQTPMTPQAAAALMGNIDKNNVSKFEIDQLQQIGAAYGNIQTNLVKQLEDRNQRRKSVSPSISPEKSNNLLPNNSNPNSNNISSPNDMKVQQQHSMLNSTVQRKLSVHTNQHPNLNLQQPSQVTTPFPEYYQSNNSYINQQQNIPFQKQIPQSRQFTPINNQVQTPNPNPDINNRQTQPQNRTSFTNTPIVDASVPKQIKANTSNVLPDEVKRNLSNISIVRYLRYNDVLTCRHEKPNLPYLKQMVCDFFCTNAFIDIVLKLGNDSRSYRISYSLLPFVYYKYLENVQMFEVSQKFINVDVLSNGYTILNTDHYSFKCVFEDGSYCNHFGSIRIRMNNELMFEKMEVVTDYNVHGIEFTALEKFLNEFNFLQNKKKLQEQENLNTENIKSYFQCINNLTKFGFNDNLLRLLQISDVMTLTKPLIHFYAKSKFKSPLEALEVFNKINQPTFEKLNKMYSEQNQNLATKNVQTEFSNNRPMNQFPNQQQLPTLPLNQSQVRSHRGSMNSVNTPNSVGQVMNNPILTTTKGMDNSVMDTSTLSDGNLGFLNNKGNGNNINNNIIIPLKRSNSDIQNNQSTIPPFPHGQIVTKKSNKQIKLQPPPIPNKSNRKNKITKDDLNNNSNTSNNNNNNNNIKLEDNISSFFNIGLDSSNTSNIKNDG